MVCRSFSYRIRICSSLASSAVRSLSQNAARPARFHFGISSPLPSWTFFSDLHGSSASHSGSQADQDWRQAQEAAVVRFVQVEAGALLSCCTTRELSKMSGEGDSVSRAARAQRRGLIRLPRLSCTTTPVIRKKPTGRTGKRIEEAR